MRRAPSVDALLPALYLKGVSTGDFLEALTGILGEGVSGLFQPVTSSDLRAVGKLITRYRGSVTLSAKRYAYWWANGVYFNVRLDEERTCVLVLIGATEEGTKELLAVIDGYRESTQSWRELIRGADSLCRWLDGQGFFYGASAVPGTSADQPTSRLAV